MKLKSMAVASVALCALASQASADWRDPMTDSKGWYVGVGAGFNELQNFKYAGSGGDASYLDSWIATGALGYKYRNWRLEIEGSGTHDKFDGPYSGGTIWTGASVNLLRDFPIWHRLNAYVGGGVGVGNNNTEEYGPVSAAGRFDQWAFQWQGIAGLSYAWSRHVDLYTEYRYRGLETGHAELFGSGADVNASPLRANVVLVGLRWYPWAAEPEAAPPPPPPPPPAPPPPPPPPPPVKTFIVFFDFNKSNLTSEAEQVVTEAVKSAKANGFVKVLVTGHTDTVGSDSYNQGLSVRRAEAVKDEMVREGLDGAGIAIEGKSFHDPLVPTGPGVREPQNRRAVIDLGG